MSDWLKRSVLPHSGIDQPEMLAQAIHIPDDRGGLIALCATSYRAPSSDPNIDGVQVLLAWGPVNRAACPWSPEWAEDVYREWWASAHGQEDVSDADLAIAEEHFAHIFDTKGPRHWPTTSEILDGVSAVCPLGTVVQAPAFTSNGWQTKTAPPVAGHVMTMELRGVIVQHGVLGVNESRGVLA